jgi:hypothetical protein
VQHFFTYFYKKIVLWIWELQNVENAAIAARKWSESVAEMQQRKIFYFY